MRTTADHLQDSIKRSLARIRTTDGSIVGSGFLASESHVLTCAHVADQADRGSGKIALDFPFFGGKTQTAWVVSRQPEQRSRAFPPGDGLDVALLQIETAAPTGSRPARLVHATDLWKQPFRCFGFPPDRDDGVWVEGCLRDEQARGWVELDPLAAVGYFVVPGFSGTAVWSETVQGVVGMIVAADEHVKGSAAYMLPTRKLLDACPVLATSGAGRQVGVRGSCLLLLPGVKNRENLDHQTEDVENVIVEAIKAAGLKLHPHSPRGLVVRDIDAELVPLLCEAEIVVVDANCYSSGEFSLSPYLYYFLGVRHSLGNDTILVSRSDAHLPFSLQRRPHTLVYDPTRPASVREFTNRFGEVVRKILARAEERPDNPVQQYREELARREELERFKAENEMLNRLCRQPPPKEPGHRPRPQEEQPIHFRPV